MHYVCGLAQGRLTNKGPFISGQTTTTLRSNLKSALAFARDKIRQKSASQARTAPSPYV